MKKKSCFLILLFAASVIFTGCRDDNEHGDGSQTTSAEITTTSPWTSSVRETTGTRATAETTATTRSTVDWLTFSPQSGGAGRHTIIINLTANRTGEDRSAVITIESEELIITIDVTQRYVPRGSSYEYLLPVADPMVAYAPNPIAIIRRMAYYIRRYFQEIQSLYYKLDNRYSTFTSRAHFSSSFFSDVNMFWERSYRTIRQFDVFLTEVPRMLETHPNAADVERAFLENKGKLLASKGLIYFYLNTKFGGVPIVTDFEIPNYQFSRATWSEVSEFVRTTLHEAIPLLDCDEKVAKCWRVLALIALQKEEYQQAMGYLQQSIGVLSGIHIPTYLLYAETRLKIGQKAQAIARVNQVLQEKGKELLPSDATDDEILAAIKANFPDEDTGMKYINAVRWGTWGAEWDETVWGARPPAEFRKFLPIPQRDIYVMPNLVQNPGW